MTDRELMQQALDALERYGGVDQRACDAEEALRERLAQPQQSHEINADTDAIGMAIHDAFLCGTGVVKLWLDAGKMTFDHVPIKDFNVFADELKWRVAHTGKEKADD